MKPIFTKTHESLRDYSDEELLQILQRNETEQFAILLGVCSEILRRCFLDIYKSQINVKWDKSPIDCTITELFDVLGRDDIDQCEKQPFLNEISNRAHKIMLQSKKKFNLASILKNFKDHS
jgi:hypothetical protein